MADIRKEANILKALCQDHLGEDWGMLCVPTPDVWHPKINGTQIPLRIWRAITTSGIKVDMHVLSIVAHVPEVTEKLRAELPSYFQRSAGAFDIAD